MHSFIFSPNKAFVEDAYSSSFLAMIAVFVVVVVAVVAFIRKTRLKEDGENLKWR